MQKQILNFSNPVQFCLVSLLSSKYYVWDCSQQKKPYTICNAMYSYISPITSLIYFVKIVCEGTISKRHIYFSIWVFFYEHSRFTGQQRNGEAIFFNSSLPLPPVPQTFRHQPRDYCGELTSSHFQQLDLSLENSERKSINTKLRVFRTQPTI